MIAYKAGCVNCGRLLVQDGKSQTDESMRIELKNGCAICGKEMLFIFSGYSEEYFYEKRARKIKEEENKT